jgi:thiol-disulfide isomerase/thioredoxin
MKAVILGFFLCVSTFGYSQKAEVVKFDSVQKILESQTGEIQIINFWATWCAPCVKELPLFEKLYESTNSNVQITLISLDFSEEIEKVNMFISRKKIATKVLLLDEIDYNKWIDKVDKTWSGAIPATLILNSKTGKRKFVEKELMEGDLQKLINEVI